MQFKIKFENSSEILRKYCWLTWEPCTTVKTATPKKRKKSIKKKDIAPVCLVPAWVIHAPKEDGADGSLTTPTTRKLIYFNRLKQTRKKKNNCQDKIKKSRWTTSKQNLLAKAVAAVKIIAKTSRRRKIKKSHLFFCTKCWYRKLD